MKQNISTTVEKMVQTLNEIEGVHAHAVPHLREHSIFVQTPSEKAIGKIYKKIRKSEANGVDLQRSSDASKYVFDGWVDFD